MTLEDPRNILSGSGRDLVRQPKSERRRTMSIANPEAETLTMKQRVFIGVLGVLSVLLAALVVFYFSLAGETSEALPGQHLSPTVYEDGFGGHSGEYRKSDQRHIDAGNAVIYPHGMRRRKVFTIVILDIHHCPAVEETTHSTSSRNISYSSSLGVTSSSSI
jgi:hypothetical protein